MTIWRVPSVEKDPVIRLADWRVYALAKENEDRRTLHFVGYNLDFPEGRVSTAIVSYDPEARSATTRSGRVYQLIGGPGTGSPDGTYTFNRWCDISSIIDREDVTCEFLVAGVAVVE